MAAMEIASDPERYGRSGPAGPRDELLSQTALEERAPDRGPRAPGGDAPADPPEPLGHAHRSPRRDPFPDRRALPHQPHASGPAERALERRSDPRGHETPRPLADAATAAPVPRGLAPRRFPARAPRRSPHPRRESRPR